MSTNALNTIANYNKMVPFEILIHIKAPRDVIQICMPRASGRLVDIRAAPRLLRACGDVSHDGCKLSFGRFLLCPVLRCCGLEKSLLLRCQFFIRETALFDLALFFLTSLVSHNSSVSSVLTALLCDAKEDAT